MNKKISIIIPVYNAEENLKLMLDSILNQTYKNYEIILINDGSTDKSLDILNKYKNENPNIIKVYSRENKGVSATRNEGLEYVTGEYLTFCDNDDFIEKDYLETFIKANDNDYDIVIGGYLRTKYSGKTLFERKLENKKIAPYIQLACWGKLYKTSFVREKKLRFLNSKIADDLYFNVVGYNLTDKIKVIPDTKYHWMYNDESLSNTENKRLQYAKELVNVLDEINNYFKDNECSDRELLEYFYLRTIIYYILFSTKKVDKEKIDETYQYMFNWLSGINSNYSKNKYIGLFKDYGEQFSVKLVISGFMILKKLNLIKIFIHFYSKI